MSLKTVLVIAIVLASLAVLLILLVFLQRLWFRYNQKRNEIVQNHLMRRAVFSEDINIRTGSYTLLKNLFILTQKVKLHQDSLNEVYSILFKKKSHNKTHTRTGFQKQLQEKKSDNLSIAFSQYSDQKGIACAS